MSVLHFYVKSLADGGQVNLSTAGHHFEEEDIESLQMFLDEVIDIITRGQVTAVIVPEGGPDECSIHFTGAESVLVDIIFH